MSNVEDRPTRSVEYSKTENVHILKYQDINGIGRLFGGTLMSWIDETGGTAAMRHAGCPVTTAAVDNLQFKHGAKKQDIVVVEAKLTYVGNTSIEVRCDTYVETLGGMRYHINQAYLTYVAMSENGEPRRVPYALEIKTETEKAEWEGAIKRTEMWKKRRSEGF